MSQPSEATLELASLYRQRLAGSDLTRSAARLYSHHVRLREAQPGLVTWREGEALERLDEAVHLIEAALIERETGENKALWRDGFRRAGELLEWLSHPEISPSQVPTALLSAAAYQLAGYPARSAGLLTPAEEKGASEAFFYLLGADFPGLLQVVTSSWSDSEHEQQAQDEDDSEHSDASLHDWIIEEIMRALGVFAAEMRWGDETRTERAVSKLSAGSRLLLHGVDPYSWLLSKLCAGVAETYRRSTMRRYAEDLRNNLSDTGEELLDRYLRHRYRSRKLLTWPSQARGIRRLASNEPFALCAPTGSGKTTVAELGILQGLFPASSEDNEGEEDPAPIAMYLVPSRALAGEVESRLADLVRSLGDEHVTVTGLYGGNDWGPTDAWLTRADRTVLICTYEKAEALIRFLGPIFIDRVSLVVVDEAHRVQFDGKYEALYQAESRPLRLEVLTGRLLAYVSHSRIVALSAVAAGLENVLASWVAGELDTTAERTAYRSTRQLIGRLECLPNRRFRIEYDLLDGAALAFEEAGGGRNPYVPNPFPPYPDTGNWDKTGSETRLRPYLFWAAMNLAAQREEGHQRAVLISVTQQIGGYATDLLSLLESAWSENALPTFFQPPTEPGKHEMWTQCLRSCADYFGADSQEYRLLEKGIVLHHGKMPGCLARILVQVIEQRIVNLVIATSTLTEGLNLPFETVLVPTLRRGSGDLSPREFGNLAGRAGRPGAGTEGRSLVLMPPPLPGDSLRETRSIERARRRYSSILEGLQEGYAEASAESPLAKLLSSLREQWALLSGTDDASQYLQWLEQTAPLQVDLDPEDNSVPEAIQLLDALDGVLMTAVVELEELAGQELSPDELESRLRQIWRRSYAYFATAQEAALEEAFLRRGLALVGRVYPEPPLRRRLYRTGLPPRSGVRLLELYGDLRLHLETGTGYARWDLNRRFAFIETTVNMLASHPKFQPEEKASRQEVDWRQVLRWWLDPTHASAAPSPTQVSHWHAYVRHNFAYRFNWGVGNLIALAMEDVYTGEPQVPELESWPALGLPWAVFWMKELVVWGTLEPLAAYLLSRAKSSVRDEAEAIALRYYMEHPNVEDDELLNATHIRGWTERHFPSSSYMPVSRPPTKVKVDLLRDFGQATSKEWRVLPLQVDGVIRWVDPAGFHLAEGPSTQEWDAGWLHEWDFYLDPVNQTVSSTQYLP